jgi:hypothetical protein|tara:strand:+ start:7936 stop:8571 length:636 start_codon:yes stop_codon:yes gene_type:complete
VNIFALSRNPQEAALEMLDKHIVKMPTETCQMLHTNVLYFDYIEHYGEEPTLAQVKQFHRDINSKLMKPAMLNHPSTIWARQNPHNTRWLYEHGKALCEEYTYRYGKVHGSQSRILDIAYTIDEDSNWSFATPVTIAMDDKYRLVKDNRIPDWDFVINSYRHYYLQGKWRFAEWRANRMPTWWPKDHYKNKYNEGIDNYNKRWNAKLERLE